MPGPDRRRETQGEDAGPFGPAPIRRIVVPLDGTPFAERAIEPALLMGRLFDASVTLFRAVSPPTSWASNLVDTEERREELLRRAKAEAETYLDTLRSRVDEGSCAVDCVVDMHRSPARSILEHVVDSGADFVVLTTGKRYALSRGLLGSVADKVARGSSTPVLVVRGPEEESPSDD